MSGRASRRSRLAKVRLDGPVSWPLDQPVTELGGLDVSAFSQRDADTARGVTVNLDCPMRGFGHGLKKREPPFGIGLRIRVRESVCEVAPNIAVVREPQQRAFVASRPVANHTLGALDLHPRTISFGRLTSTMRGNGSKPHKV